MRLRRFFTFLLFVLVTGTFVYAVRRNFTGFARDQSASDKDAHITDEPELFTRPEPLPVSSDREHPIELLVKDNEREHRAKIDRQSTTLQEAVKEYKRRYGMPPPPRFDDWYRFAKRKGVVMIDDYDAIHSSLLPFWGLKPKTVRDRVKEVVGGEQNAVIAIMIRGGKITHKQGSKDTSRWVIDATAGMLENFVEFLPDMDLAFNTHDEPRVVVPRDSLDKLVALGLARQASLLGSKEAMRNSFSSKPQDLTSGLKVLEVKKNRFSHFRQQPVWISSCLSCPMDSPVRALEIEQAHDDLTKYALGPLGFISNHTAFTDICNTPALGTSHGFFERPNQFGITHDLMPIFSQSKVSSYQDIIFPSPWYWSNKVEYNAKKDIPWQEKAPKLWWVGSTTGGYSRRGGWRHQHRQRLVAKLNALDTARVMRDQAKTDGTSGQSDTAGENPEWVVHDVERRDYAELMDVHFSHVGQCEQNDCDAQKEFFTIVPSTDFQSAWKSKFLLDIDGNAFSGRFYAFLKSKSLPIKMSVFREWHADWITPWAHYMPLSLRADEALEMIRYLAVDPEGKRTAERIAEQGRQWAEKVLRTEDFETWMFRLLLEYGRLVDDDRERIGYDG